MQCTPCMSFRRCHGCGLTRELRTSNNVAITQIQANINHLPPSNAMTGHLRGEGQSVRASVRASFSSKLWFVSCSTATQNGIAQTGSTLQLEGEHLIRWFTNPCACAYKRLTGCNEIERLNFLPKERFMVWLPASTIHIPWPAGNSTGLAVALQLSAQLLLASTKLSRQEGAD